MKMKDADPTTVFFKIFDNRNCIICRCMIKVLDIMFKQYSNNCLASGVCVGESATSLFNEMGISVNTRSI